MTTPAIIALAAALTIPPVFLAVVTIRHARQRAGARMEATMPDGVLREVCLCMGTTRSRQPRRGNGLIALGERELQFSPYIGASFLLPYSSIEKVTIKRSFNGKYIARPLLCVRYTATDQSASTAWCVPNPNSWANELLRRCPSQEPTACSPP